MTAPSPLQRKVAGLLYQAEGAATEHEAEVFRHRAMELMAKYGLDEAEVRAARADPGKVVVRSLDVVGEYNRLQVRLLHRLAAALHCESTHRTDYALVTLYGVEAHVARVLLLFELLRPQLQAAVAGAAPEPDAWLDARERAARTRSHRRSFGIGWVAGVASILQQEETKVAESPQARSTGADLVLLSDAEKARKQLALIHPKVRPARWAGAQSQAYHEGHARGREADLVRNRLAPKRGITG